MYDENQTYILLNEDGHHEEIGKDYNRIYLYLCISEDYNDTLVSDDESEDEGTSHSASKYSKCKNNTAHADESEDEGTPHSASKYAKLENTTALTTTVKIRNNFQTQSQ